MGYVFDPGILQQVVRQALAKRLPTDEMIKTLVADLAKHYPGHISTTSPWLLNNAGGAMGAMYILHASITEYVMIFGTPLGTEGHTGRFRVDDYFFILEGEQWAFSAGNLQREVYRAGDMHHLPRRHAKQYKMPEGCWALEYARGAIPLMMPFGLADTLTSTLDFNTFGRTVWIYTKCVVRELLRGKI